MSHWYELEPEKKRESNPGSSALETDALTTRPTKRLGEADRKNAVLSVGITILVNGRKQQRN